MYEAETILFHIFLLERCLIDYAFQSLQFAASAVPIKIKRDVIIDLIVAGVPQEGHHEHRGGEPLPAGFELVSRGSQKVQSDALRVGQAVPLLR